MADMSTAEHQAIRVRDNIPQAVHENLVVEEPLQININNRPFSITMRTPGADRELVVGLLFAEGVVEPAGLSGPVEISQRTGYTDAQVTVPEIFLCENLLEKRSLLANAACGFCGKREVADIRMGNKPLQPGRNLEAFRIPHMLERLRKGQTLFDRTGGCHAAAAFRPDGSLIVLYEDVGRHNAVDKVVGHLVCRDLLEDTNILLVSGRISYEIVSKAYAAGIAFICAVSAPSSMAVAMADSLGMSIVAFCRDNRFTVYTHSHQVSLPNPSHAESPIQ